MLAILYRVIDDCPVLVAANREEFHDRQGTPPEFWKGSPSIVAGRDPRAGGTWLGVNQHGVLCAVTNRPKEALRSPPRSRGLLCVDLLRCRTAREAHERALDLLDHHSRAGCNVLAIDASGGYVIHGGELLRSCPLPPGIHVVTAHDLNDSSDGRIAYALGQLSGLGQRTAERWIEELTRLCRAHGGPDHPPICMHSTDRGTVSSSIISLPVRPQNACWLHAQGPPCTRPYVSFSHLLTAMFAGTSPVKAVV